MTERSAQEEDITIAYIYKPNIAAPKDMIEVLMGIKVKINSNTLMAGDFNTPLTSMHRSFRMKINKEIMALNAALDQPNLIDT